MESPYRNINSGKWKEVTTNLIHKHPLDPLEIRDIVLDSWSQIFESKIGKKPFKIGRDIFPKPQIMGFLLHEIIPLELETKYPDKWRKEKTAKDKDLIFIPDDHFSIEIKTSSNPTSIFGNRSYAQESSKGKKTKSGYYLAINFEKFADETSIPRLLKIRFGWLDHEDWTGQKAATGQQCRLSREVENLKLLELWPNNQITK